MILTAIVTKIFLSDRETFLSQKQCSLKSSVAMETGHKQQICHQMCLRILQSTSDVEKCALLWNRGIKLNNLNLKSKPKSSGTLIHT